MTHEEALNEARQWLLDNGLGETFSNLRSLTALLQKTAEEAVKHVTRHSVAALDEKHEPH